MNALHGCTNKCHWGAANGAINVHKVRNVCTRVFIFTKVAFIISVRVRPVLVPRLRSSGAENFLEALYRRAVAEAPRAFSGR